MGLTVTLVQAVKYLCGFIRLVVPSVLCFDIVKDNILNSQGFDL